MSAREADLRDPEGDGDQGVLEGEDTVVGLHAADDAEG